MAVIAESRDGDRCSAICDVEPAMALGEVYLTGANGEPGFHGYTIASDTWATLASPPDVTCAQITDDGQTVCPIGLDNTIHRDDIEGDFWSRQRGCLDVGGPILGSSVELDAGAVHPPMDGVRRDDGSPRADRVNATTR